MGPRHARDGIRRWSTSVQRRSCRPGFTGSWYAPCSPEASASCFSAMCDPALVDGFVMPARYRTHRVGREVRHGLSKFLTQGATQRLLRLLMMTKQNYVAHRPDRAIDRKTKIFCRSPRFQARTLRIRVNYKFPFP